ncbi:MAG: hypothetical protein GXY77_19410 [Fibrobacter sp.]|nr:hypothetical protein [Fibrobacter sp.]
MVHNIIKNIYFTINSFLIIFLFITISPTNGKPCKAINLTSSSDFKYNLQKVIQTGNITWYFDSAYPVGTFANGDYWVRGPITIDSITPRFDGHSNGFEINPIVEGDQGFQDDCAGGNFDPNLDPNVPLYADPSNGILSIVKSIPTGDDRPCIKFAAVLSVVKTIPPNNGNNVFRPPYVGTKKPYYLVDSIKSYLLPKYKTVSNVPSYDSLANKFKHLRIDHKTKMTGDCLRPSMAMSNYQPDNVPGQNDAVLSFMMDKPLEEKMPALINFLQFGIDKIYTVLLGQTWPVGAGHQPGHRLPLAFTAVMLGIDTMKQILSDATWFHGSIYFYTGRNGVVLWGDESTEWSYWNYIMREEGSRTYRDPYQYIDGGKLTDGSYQFITSQSHKGEILAVQLMPILKEYWNVKEFNIVEKYVDRWVLHGVWSMPDPYAPFDNDTNNYGKTFGPDLANNGKVIQGNGRFPEIHGERRDGGSRRSAFVDTLWKTYRATAPSAKNLPPFAVVTKPLDGNTINSIYTIHVTAFSIHDIKSIVFAVNDTSKGAFVRVNDNSTDYVYSLETRNYPNGQYKFTAIAEDTLGNYTTSPCVNIKIIN